MRSLFSALLIVGLLLAFAAAPAFAHGVVVDPPGEGDVKVQWAGGPNVPGQGKGLMPNPFGLQPAAHGKGLVTACNVTRDNPSVVFFAAPPHFTGCVHGEP